MYFESGHLYHIYNQGNNRQRIFFKKENYLFFIRKIRKHLLPFCDVLAYCLMPNHFHLMVQVNKIRAAVNSSDDLKSSEELKIQILNDSVAVMLRSYTRAINKQKGRSGSLFRAKTKAECLTQVSEVTPSFFNTNAGTLILTEEPEKQYPKVCFNYIHLNPVKAGLVSAAVDWEFSSARDYAGLRKGTLANKELAIRYDLV